MSKTDSSRLREKYLPIAAFQNADRQLDRNVETSKEKERIEAEAAKLVAELL